jgi:hypothetical protein
MRYPDDLEPGFNLVLSQPKLLTELDFSVHEVRKGFTFARTLGKLTESYLDALTKVKDEALLKENSAFTVVARAEIFTRMRQCYELRVLPEGNFIEATYETSGMKDDRDFNQTALRPAP